MTQVNPATGATIPPLLVSMATSLGRHLLTGLATLLIGIGAIMPGSQEQFVSIGIGVVMWLVGMFWSYVQKRFMHKQVTGAMTLADARRPMVAPNPAGASNR